MKEQHDEQSSQVLQKENKVGEEEEEKGGESPKLQMSPSGGLGVPTTLTLDLQPVESSQKTVTDYI